MTTQMFGWIMLLAGALLAGAGLPLGLREPFDGALWVGAGMVVVGLMGMGMGLWRLMGIQEPTLEDESDDGPRRLELGADQVSALVLRVVEEALEMLRLASTKKDIDEITHLVLGVQTVASRLGVEKESLRVRGSQARDILSLARKLAAVHRRLLDAVGRDPEDAGPTLSVSHLQIGLASQTHRLEACSGGLVHLSRQFEDRPALREGLNSAAQSVRMYLASKGVRLGSSQEEIALAPTVRLPDIPLLERVRAELQAIEKEHSAEGGVESSVLESARHRLEKLAEASMPMGTQTVQPIVQEVSINLKAAAESLGRGEVGEAASRVDKVLRVVRAEN